MIINCRVCGEQVETKAANRKYCQRHSYEINYKRWPIPDETPANSLRLVLDPHPLSLQGYTFTLEQIKAGMKPEVNIFWPGSIFRRSRDTFKITEDRKLVPFAVKGGLSHDE